MTEEQLAKLDPSGGPLCCGIHEALVQRLLLERKRLLEALRREHDSDTGISQESLAALEFAEEAAR